MKRTTDNQKLNSNLSKRQKQDTEMSTKMKQMKPSTLCPYERTRMETVQTNAAKMKALGYNSLVNKVLLEKYDSVAKGVVGEVTNNDMELQHKVSKNVNSSRSKKDKQPLVQTLPMAEFIVRERLPSTRGSQQNKQPPLIQQPGSVMSSAPSEAQVQNSVQIPEIQQKNKLASQQEKGQEEKGPRYCAPGSMKRYAAMILNQGSKGQKHVDNVANLPLVEEHPAPKQSTVASDQNEINVVEEAILTQVQVERAPDIIQNESNEDPITREKKHRGKTILAQIHARTMDKRPPVLFNDLGQPVGPTKEVVLEFSHLLGTLAKDSAFAPLNYVNWRYMPLKDKIWDYVQKKFIVEKDAKKYVLQNVNEKWRLHKTRMKAKYYKEDENMEQRMMRRPNDIPEEEFKDLMLFWDTEKVKEISRKNKENRAKQCDMHTLGPKSFAMLRDEMKQTDLNNQAPSQADLYIKSRERKPGRTYLTSNEETLDNIEKMETLKTNLEGSTQVDPYYDVITKKEHYGRLRTYGLGVTKSTLKNKDSDTPYKIPSVFTQQIEKTMAQQMEKKVAEQVEKTIAEQMEQTLSYIMSKIREVNQGIDVHIPDFTTIQEDLSSSHVNSIRDHVDDLDGTSPT